MNATFSSNGSAEPSAITDVKPAWMAERIVSKLEQWSRCIATGTLASFARALTRSTNAENEMIDFMPGYSIRMTGRREASAPRMHA